MSEQQQVRPGILLISTGKYKQFVQSLLNEIDSLFLSDYHKKIFLFTDEWQPELESKNHLIQIRIPPYRWPYATLYRYRIFSEHSFQLQSCTHLYYFDVDMSIKQPINQEFIVDGLLIVRHPGFYVNNGWGDSSNHVNSKSYLPEGLRKHYYCGGVQGGHSLWYLMASRFMADGISEDEKNGIMAEWNDETFWNHLIHTQNYPTTEFNSEYCMPEQKNLQQQWGLSNLTPRIIALSKDHKSIRS